MVRVTRALVTSAILALGATAPTAVVAEVVYGSSATFEWGPARGPVAGYAVYVERDNRGFPSTPELTTEGNGRRRATLTGSEGETIRVWVAALDANGELGPFSPPSDDVRFADPSSRPSDPGGSPPASGSGGSGRSPVQVSNLSGTGTDGDGARLSIGTADPYYALSAPAGDAVVLAPHPAWVQAPAGAAWIGPAGATPPGDYVYTLELDLGSVDPATARLSGRWAADDTAEIYVNGLPTGIVKSEGRTYETLDAFTITSGFMPGVNTIEFRVRNLGNAENPTGLLVVDLDVSSDPESAVVGAPADANSIFDLPGSGTDGGGARLSIGTADPYYVLSAPADDAVVLAPHPAWVQAPAGAAWIGPAGATPPGDYVYTLELDLGSVDPATARLSGRWAADDTAEIYVNGLPTGIVKTEGRTFEALDAFTITSGFMPGVNTIEFRVRNLGNAENPTGLLVANLELSSNPESAVVPAPADANSIFDLPGSGTDGGGARLSLGTADPYYVLSAPADDAVVLAPHPAWVQAPAGAAWIGPAVAMAPGDYVYTLELDLGSVDPATARLSGRWAADDTAEIYVNGFPTGIVKTEGRTFEALDAFTITSGFVAGVNTIEFRIRNLGNAENPTGLLVTDLTLTD